MKLLNRFNGLLTMRLLGAGSLLALAALTTGCETDGSADYDDDDDDRAVYYRAAAYQPTTTTHTVVYEQPYQETEVFTAPNRTYREQVAYAAPSGTRYYREPEQRQFRETPTHGEFGQPQARMELNVAVDSPKPKPEKRMAKANQRPAKVEKPAEKPEERMITADTPGSDPIVDAKPIEGSRLVIPEPKAPAKKTNQVTPPETIGSSSGGEDKVGAASVGYAVATYR